MKSYEHFCQVNGIDGHSIIYIPFNTNQSVAGVLCKLGSCEVDLLLRKRP